MPPAFEPASTDALYLSWKLPATEPAVIARAQRRLWSGEARRLYRLRSWVIVSGEVRALVAPATSLEGVVNAIWGAGAEPVATRWIPTRDCARIARDIETAPVSLGLAERPERWPLSSAACL